MTKLKGSKIKWSNPLILQIMLFSIAFLLYSNTLTHDYTQDDAIVIYDNMFTTKGINGIPGILTNDTFYGFFKEEGKAKLVSGGRYRPLTQVMFAIEWELFGDKPFFGHLINVLLFALLVLLLFNTLRKLLKEHFTSDSVIIFSFLAALIFAVHPIHTEVVANIKGRDEIMSLFLSLSTLWLILSGLDNKRRINYLWAALLFILALLSKENAITFVAVIPLAILMFKTKTKGQYIFVFSSLLVATFIFMLIRTSILGLDFGSNSMELMNNPFLKLHGGKYVDFSFSEKFATILFTLGKYLQLQIFPHPLTHDYYPRQIGIMSIIDWRVILSFLLYLGFVIVAFIRFKKDKIIVFSILYYLFTLSIVSNIVFPIGTNMSERFLFMPSVGFSMLVALLGLRFYTSKKWLTVSLLLLVVFAFSYKTLTRNPVWKDDYTLFNTDVKTSKNSAKVLNAAGGSLLTRFTQEKPSQEKGEKMLREAISYLERAIEIHPTYKNAYLILGNAHFYLDDYNKAIEVYQNALKFAPQYPEVQKNLAIAHREAGKDYGMNKNDLTMSLFHLKKAYDMLSTDYETVRLYAIANVYSGNTDSALKLFKEAILIEPNNAGAYLNLGNLYFSKGDDENGQLNFEKALELDPDIINELNQ